MFSNLLAADIQDFINSNLNNDVAALALQKNKFPDRDFTEILNQIAAKQKAKNKLPTWFSTANIIYPTKLSIEQTSSEKTAAYKSSIVSGEKLIDLTGGFGVDDYYFAKKVVQVIHCEINPTLSEIASHNFKQMEMSTVECIAGDSSQILKDLNKQFDWIYIDPSRRNEGKGKVFMLKDCLPNVPDLLDFYFGYTQNIMIKTAPILDVSAGLQELENVAQIHVIAVENEVKELLWVLKGNYSKPIEIITCNLLKDKVDTFSFFYTTPSSYTTFVLPRKYLYEPNAAIMKSGGFDKIIFEYEVEKLHQHSHLYTSDVLIDFPGRVFEIENIIGYNKSEMKSVLENKKANITIRNFPDTVEIIRKRWNIKEGGDLYCFFTTNATNDKIVLLCNKIK